MAYRVILAVLSGRTGDIAVLEAAHIIARHFDAHVDALFVKEKVRSLPYLKAGVAPGFVSALVTEAESGVEYRRNMAKHFFDHGAQKAGLCVRPEEQLGPPSALLSVSWLERDGGKEQVSLQGRVADLIVMAQPIADSSTDDGVIFEGVVESALLDTGRPVLFIPPEITQFPPLEDWVALLAWNGSTESARAVGAAVPMLVAAKSTTIFCGVEDGKHTGCDAGELKRLQRYLSLQCVQADIQHTAVKSSEAGERILARAVETDAEVIVMGAFTHARIHELVLGGATKHVLYHAHVPVLMAH